MTFGPPNTLSSYLPVEFALPDGKEEFKDFLAKRERLTASIVNIKENGNYENIEILTAQTWFSVEAPGVTKRPRYTFRKVIDFGSIDGTGGAGPYPSTKSVAHGIAIDSNFIFTKIYAVASDQVGLKYQPIPYADPTAQANEIAINVDATNVNIIVGKNQAAYTVCYVILEYIKR